MIPDNTAEVDRAFSEALARLRVSDVTPAEFEEMADHLWASRATLPVELAEFLMTTVHVVRQTSYARSMPGWAVACFEHLPKIIFPTVFRSPANASVPHAIGAVAGHSHAMLDRISRDLATGPNELTELMPVFEMPLEEMTAFVRQLNAGAVRQRTDVFAAYTGAASKAASGTFTEFGKLCGATDASEFYMLFAFFWRQINSFQSAKEFNAWLATVKPSISASNDERVDKIRERIGLRFPGRE